MSRTNQDRLQSLVESNSNDQTLLWEFSHFHLSVKQKLWSINYYYDEILKLRPEIHYLPRTKTTSLIVDQSPNPEWFGLYTNLLLDGFLMTSMSSLDTLAHEIRLLYIFQNVLDRLYITYISHLQRDHPNSYITDYLTREINKDWFRKFAKYRHCTTHESLVGASVDIRYGSITGDPQQATVPIPDDPTDRPLTFTENRELKSYCFTVRNHIIEMIRHSYYCIIQDIGQSNNTLPIPQHFTFI